MTKISKDQIIDTQIQKLLGFKSNEKYRIFLATLKSAAAQICKPCWELKYCPYGPFVEELPALPPTRDEVEGFEFEGLSQDDFPESIPIEILEYKCTVFGHICPVFLAAEGFTETSETRRKGRYISFKIKVRVVRRDNYTCQNCGKHLLDNEVEFDHKIPLSKGGSSEEHNIRLTCFKCNRDKRQKVNL